MKGTRNLQVVSGMCIAVALLLVLFAASVPAQTQPSKPSAELRQLDVWLGDWKYEIVVKDTPLGPAGKVVGSQAVRWILNGCFVEFKWQEKGPLGDSSGVEIDWYDAAKKRFAWQGYVEGGDMYAATATVSGNVWTISGTQTHNGITYQVRGEATFAADGLSNTWKNEMSTDGKKWIPWSEGKSTKIASQDASVEQEIIRLERVWAETSVKRDVDALARLLADDLTSGNAEGKWLTKAQLLAELKSGEYGATSAACDDMKVRVYGDVAIITGRTTEKSQYKGVDSSGQYIWTDTWKKRGGVWQCVATHGSKVGTKIGP